MNREKIRSKRRRNGCNRGVRGVYIYRRTRKLTWRSINKSTTGESRSMNGEKIRSKGRRERFKGLTLGAGKLENDKE